MKTDPVFLFSMITCFIFAFQTVRGQNEENALKYGLKQNLDDIRAITDKVNQQNTEGRLRLAGELDEKWLLRAISLKMRTRWADQEMLSAGERKLFDPVYQSLASSIAKKISGFKPAANLFAFPASSEEEIAMKSVLDNSGTLNIHRIGMIEQQGQQMGNNAPRKKGYIWASNSADDYHYCHLYEIILTKDYSGEGKYEGDLRGMLSEDILAGCP